MSPTNAEYALSESHKEVSSPLLSPLEGIDRSIDSQFFQMLEKSLLDSDPEVASIMVRYAQSGALNLWQSLTPITEG